MPHTRTFVVSLRLVGLFVALMLLGWTPPSRAAEPDSPVLRVGTKVSPPFVVRRPDGRLDGPSIRLWRELADELGRDYELEERPLEELLSGLRDGSLDVSIAAITVTAERERTVDFSHPYHTAGLAIAAERRHQSVWSTVLATVFSRSLLELVGFLAIVQLAVGVLVYLLERRTNPQFSEGTARGVFAGFWWSTVTMTTVGYGDKAPVTIAGRLVALAWMLCSVVIIASFTASAASRLTVAELEAELSGPDDLVRVRVGVVGGTTGEQYARGAGLDFSRFATAGDAVQALAAGELDAVVHDAPLLEQLTPQDGDLVVLPARFQRQDYAIAFPEGSPLREPVNRILPARAQSIELDGGR